MVTQISLTQAYQAAGYTYHFDAHSNEAALKVPCAICSGKCIYVGFKKTLYGHTSYVAISRCTKCGHEFEF